MQPKKSHKYKLVFGICISIILILIAFNVATVRISYFGRASSGSGGAPILSRENSYLFASPVTASADGASIVRVTVYILNSQGLGISGQKILLTPSKQLTIGQTQPTTDSFGRAIFDLTSSTPGDYTISAAVASVSLPQTVSILFQ